MLIILCIYNIVYRLIKGHRNISGPYLLLIPHDEMGYFELNLSDFLL